MNEVGYTIFFFPFSIFELNKYNKKVSCAQNTFQNDFREDFYRGLSGIIFSEPDKTEFGNTFPAINIYLYSFGCGRVERKARVFHKPNECVTKCHFTHQMNAVFY